MNIIIPTLALIGAVCAEGSSSADDSKNCKISILQQISNGKLISDTLNLSGKYLNELGNYDNCIDTTRQSPAMKYELRVFRSDVVDKNNSLTEFDMEYIMGICTFSTCDQDSLTAFDTFYIQSAMESLNSQFSTGKPINSQERLAAIRTDRTPGAWVMFSISVATLILAAIGMIVQYTKVGTLTDKNIKFQIQYESQSKQQYIDLLVQSDRLLLNRKKIWAIFFLCFSIPRNFMILFYDTEKQRKVSFMRHLKVIGFFWMSLSYTMQVSLFTFPLNYYDFPKFMKSLVGTFMASGIMYGYGIIYFYIGFQIMNDRLMCQYVKQQEFNKLLFVIKTFLLYMIPVCYTMVLIMYVMPFLGSGPIYAKVIDDFFLQGCQSYWWTNVILINNFYPWDINSTCGGQFAQIANEFQLIILLVPLLAYLYQKFNSQRRVLYMIFSVLGLMSLVAVVTITIEFNVDGYPGFMSKAFSDMYTKIYYRLPPFLIGVALSIFHFEYKHVDKLKDGSQPFHKNLIKDLVKNKLTFKILCYGVGFLGCAIPILLLVQNSSCISDSLSSSYVIYNNDVQFCWNNVGSAIYYAFSPILFYGGVVLILIPSIVGVSTILKPLLNSHLWHILEELTLFAYLLQYLVVIWFFSSRDQNTILQTGYLTQVTVSSCIMSYLLAIPFYIMVERPFKNFLDLILFPRSSIFKKQKDIDDEEDSSDEDDDTTEEIRNKNAMKIHCGFCQFDGECDCQCLITKKICKCIQTRRETQSMKLSNQERSDYLNQLKLANQKLKSDTALETEETEQIGDRSQRPDESLIKTQVNKTGISNDKRVSFNVGFK